MKKSLLDDPLDCAIVSLLAASNILPREKHIWLNLLEDGAMSHEEKLELKTNLEKEVEYEIEVSEKATLRFLTALEKGI